MKLLSLSSAAAQEGRISLHGKELTYTSQFETAQFHGGAQITAVSYTADGPGRPVVFVTNGGPGSSVLWLHLGLFGPRRIQLEDPIRPRTIPPYALEDNPHCLLDICDLVLMDPPGAGLSASPDADFCRDFYSVDGDALAFSLFMETWLETHDRTNVPIYFVGESYGTVRGAALTDALMGGPFSSQKRQVSISLAGIAFLGTAFTTAESTLAQPPAEECVRALSSCAAVTAWHYPDRFSSPAQAAHEAWCLASDYLSALFYGRTEEPSRRTALAEQLSRYTNIPVPQLLTQGLRFSIDQFRNAVLPGKSVGAYDGRYTMDGPGKPGNIPYPGMTDTVAEDPAMGMYTPAFTGGMSLLRRELGLPSGPYQAINFSVNFQWDYNSSRSPLASLENAMRRNPSMRLFFGSGLFDLVTIPGNVRYTLANSTLPMDRTIIKEYESGHMPYLGEASADKLEMDLRQFFLSV